MTPLDYDPIAPSYSQRYAVSDLPGVARLLRGLLPAGDAVRALEAGCGAGRWLAELRPRVVGLDHSAGMLRQAQAVGQPLARGDAVALPFASASFDLVFCVNALHHFGRPQAFVAEAWRVLRPGGTVAVVGMDPHAGRDRWYVYDYFPGTRAADRARFPSAGTLLDWLAAAGFARATWQVAEHEAGRFLGRAVLDDYFLNHDSTSQLALLSAADYAAGRARVESAVAAAEARGEPITFESDLWLYAVTAQRE